MQCTWQDWQQDATRVRLNHGGFVCDIGTLIRREYAENMTLGLQSAAKLQRPLARISSNNDRVNRRVRKNLLHIAKRADRLQSRIFPLKTGTEVSHQLMTAGSDQG